MPHAAVLPPPCNNFLRGFCRYGARCRFTHDLSALSLPFHHREAVVAPLQEDGSSPSSVDGVAFAPTSRHSLRVMTYNILADDYAQFHAKELYSGVPWAALEWGSRADMIAREVSHWSPDVVCFQEVDHFGHLAELLEPHGFKGTYTPRTGGRPDGLATFWKRSRFRAEAFRPLEFAPMGLKDNVCQLTVLKKKESTSSGSPQNRHALGGGGGAAVLVANIHVLFNPKRGDIKLAQVRTMLEEAHALATARPGGACPVVVCGDFNSAAGSPLYDFVVRGELDLHSTERSRLSGQVTVAGRSGWPSIQRGFMRALQQGCVTEADAIAAATGCVPHPQYPGFMGAAALMQREPLVHLGGPDSPAVDMMLPQTTPPPSRQDSVSSLASSQSTQSNQSTPSGRAPKPPKPWKRDELALAVGRGATENGGGGAVPSVARHPLHLRSAYLSVAGQEPLYTTAHDQFVGTVDYIFYSPEAPKSDDDCGESSSSTLRLRPLRVLQPPPLRTIHVGLPSLTWPSDHLCMLADFEIETPPAD